MIRDWFKKKPTACAEEDVRFLYLLCYGRAPLDRDETAPFVGQRFFATLKQLLGRPETQTQLMQRLTIGKLPPHVALDKAELRILANGAQKWLHLKALSPDLDWRALLEAAINTARFGRAFLSHYSGQRLESLRASLALFPSGAQPKVKGRILSLSGRTCSGHVIDLAAPGQPLTLEFFMNGVYAGSSLASVSAHQWAQDYDGHAPFSFEHSLTVPEALASENRVSLSVFDQASGTPIVGSRELVLSAQFATDRIQALTAELAALRTASAGQNAVLAKLDQLEFMLPGLDQYTSLSLSAYQAYRDLHPQCPPPTEPAEGVHFDILVHGAGDTDKLDVTRESLEAQSYEKYTLIPLTGEWDKTAQSFVEGINKGDGSHLMFLEAGDKLSQHALLWLAAAIRKKPEAFIFYADHDQFNPTTRQHEAPNFLQRFDYDLLVQRNFILRAFTISRHALEQIGIRDSRPSLVFHHDLMLRLYEKYGEKIFQHIPQVLWHLTKRPAHPQQLISQREQRVASVEEHLARRGIQARVAPHSDLFGGPLSDALSVRWPIDENLPKLAIIIPTKDKLELIQPCINSILSTVNHPDRIEIIILDNGSKDPIVGRWFKSLAHTPNVKVVSANQPFNWAALNNLGARETDAPYLLFLNDDTIALERGWDTRLRRQLARPEIGAVGARLLYRNGTIQHGGMVFYSLSEARHEGAEKHCNAPHPMQRTRLAHACAAVTGAFLACRRETFDALNGFDETFAVINNDVDFCFRVRDSGLTVLYDPRITFRHFQSASRGDNQTQDKQQKLLFENTQLRKKWHGKFSGDPFYPDVFARTGAPFTRLVSPPPVATNDS